MAQFPAIAPDEISFNLGGMNVTTEETKSVGPVMFRHSLKTNNYELSATFDNLSDAQVEEIREHYQGQGGSALGFSVPPVIWGGLNVVPIDSNYHYVAAPSETHGGLFNSVGISLAISVGVDYLYTLIGEPAELGAEASFSSRAFTGTEPFIMDADDAAPATAATDTLNGGNAAL